MGCVIARAEPSQRGPYPRSEMPKDMRWRFVLALAVGGSCAGPRLRLRKLGNDGLRDAQGFVGQVGGRIGTVRPVYKEGCHALRNRSGQSGASPHQVVSPLPTT
jgi:hypothetical protein